MSGFSHAPFRPADHSAADHVHADAQHTDGPNVKGGLAAVPSLVDQTGGAADDTLQNLTNPAMAPGIDTISIASTNANLANFRAEVENNLADLAAKVNVLLERMRASGQVAS